MRIISRFRDYYDAVMKSGMDRDIVYVRENKEVKLDQNYGVDFSTDHGWIGHIRYKVTLVLLGYCGHIFKVYVVEDDERHVFHEYSEFQSFMRRNGYGSAYEFEKNRWWPGSYFKFSEFNTSKLSELFHKYQTPLFIVSNKHFWGRNDETVLTLGPCLKDLQFFEVKDTYTAYQDIFQYVSGVLNAPDAKMVKITDKDKVHKHGFDKWSFRKMPTKKKNKK